MANSDDPVARHYGVDGLENTILSGLEQSGVQPADMQVDDLAGVDAFHIRGREATRELLDLADIQPGHHILDVGCGIGGTARFLVQSTGSKVSAIDLTPEYIDTARSLTAKLGLGDRIDYYCGSALELPFELETFDVVWTEHVQMNISDKKRFYSEMSRVVKPGGQLVFHDIFAKNSGEFLYPLPWAQTSEISHLTQADRVADLLSELGLKRVHWIDKTEESIAFFQERVTWLKQQGPPKVGLGMLMGPTALSKFSNVLSNLEHGLLQVVQGVLLRQGD
jgi:ubiquinone/menaquinone biosynthesis C-methylase UbiE